MSAKFWRAFETPSPSPLLQIVYFDALVQLDLWHGEASGVRQRNGKSFGALLTLCPPPPSPSTPLPPSLRSQIHSDAILQLMAERKRGELSQPEGQDLQLWPTSDVLILLMPTCNGTWCLGGGGDAG